MLEEFTYITQGDRFCERSSLSLTHATECVPSQRELSQQLKAQVVVGCSIGEYSHLDSGTDLELGNLCISVNLFFDQTESSVMCVCELHKQLFHIGVPLTSRPDPNFSRPDPNLMEVKGDMSRKLPFTRTLSPLPLRALPPCKRQHTD